MTYKDSKKLSIVIATKEKWSRRNLLARIGKASAATALMPFVPVLEAGAQSDNAVRYIQWFNANASSNVNGFWQTNSGEIDIPSGSPYVPFNKHKNDIALLGNLLLKPAQDCGRNPHNDTSFACMAGDDRVHTQGGDSYSTLDQLISHDLRARGIKTPYRNLIFGFKNPLATDHPISVDKGRRANADRDPRAVYDRLFQVAQDAGVGENHQQILLSERKQSVLDYVNDSIKKLTPIVSAEDRAKLEFHLNSISEVESRIKKIEGGASCNAFQSGDRLSTDVTERFGEEIVDAFVDLMVAAFTCDLTRVIAFQMSFGHDFHGYGWLGFSGDFHAWTHGLVKQEFDSDEREPLPGALNRVKKAMTWRHEKMVRLMDKLKAVNEPGGTLLDNTGILGWTETSRAHDYNNAMWVLGGKMGNQINTGRYQNYNGAHSNKVLTTIARAMGMQTNRVGLSKYQSGTLPELLKE